MAFGAPFHRFAIELSDFDRGVFETLDLRVARHPSEFNRFLAVRLLARRLAHEEGLEFARGVSHVVHVDEEMQEALEAAMTRAATWALTVSDNPLYVEVNGVSAVDPIHRVSLGNRA